MLCFPARPPARHIKSPSAQYLHLLLLQQQQQQQHSFVATTDGASVCMHVCALLCGCISGSCAVIFMGHRYTKRPSRVFFCAEVGAEPRSHNISTTVCKQQYNSSSTTIEQQRHNGSRAPSSRLCVRQGVRVWLVAQQQEIDGDRTTTITPTMMQQQQ